MNHPNFDRIARAYRWMEYLSFGRRLEACRFTQLQSIGDPRHALVIGDGDGRCLARLIQAHQRLTADVVDLSPVMISLARQKTKADSGRVNFYTADVRTFAFPDYAVYDLVATHFFLDCLSESEVDDLLGRVIPQLSPGALWIISEFAVPVSGWMRAPSRLLIRALYLAFRVLTGLSTSEIPNYARRLSNAGFICEETITSLGGVLRSERWRFNRA